MAYLHLLGTGSAVSDRHRTTTMLAVENDHSAVLIDCGGDAVQRLLQAEVDLDKLDAVIITHKHPDHVAGFPLLLQRLWLAGRRRPLRLIGPDSALQVARALAGVFGLEAELGMPKIEWMGLGGEGASGVIPVRHFEARFGPASHEPVTIACRLRDPESGGVVVYSSDTAPDERVAELASEADIFVHEATGSGPGHSSIADAALIAARAQVRRLLLVHLPRTSASTEAELIAARHTFSEIALGEEAVTYSFSPPSA